jgi:hypothetical protein
VNGIERGELVAIKIISGKSRKSGIDILLVGDVNYRSAVLLWRIRFASNFHADNAQES